MTPNGRIPAFVNPGGGTADRARAALQASGRYDVSDVEPDALGEVVKRAIEGGARRVLVAGGDGTVGAAATALARGAGELAVLPGGTLNHFAKDHGIPEDPVAAALAGADGVAAPADVAYVNDRLFLNTSSVGAYVTFVRTRERFEKYVGYRIASLAAAVAVIWRLRPFTVTVEADGEQRQYRTPMLFIGVGERELQMPLLGNRVAGGRSALHVLVPRGRTRGALFAFALAAAAEGVKRVSRTPRLDSFLVDSCTVSFRRPRGRVAVDGEIVSMIAPLLYRLGRDELLVVRPAGGASDPTP
jgi:diacylglycerol kinase family enzyme